MSSESRLSILNSVINDLIGVAGKAENTRIYPNAEVIDAAPADLPADYIIIVDEDGFYTPAVKVAGLNVSAGDFVNILYIKGTEPIAFQHGSESSGGGGGWPFLHVLTVDPTDADADYPTVQGACNAAVDGDAILIGASAYSEQVTITKSLTLIALGLVTLTYNTSPTLTLNGSGKTIYLEGLKVYNTDDVGDSIALQITDCQNGRALHCEFAGAGAGNADNCIGANMATSTVYTFDDCTMTGEDGTVSSVGLKTDGTVTVKNSVIYGGSLGLYIDTNGAVTINDTKVYGGITNNGTLAGSYINDSENLVVVAGNELNTDTIGETTAASGVTIDGLQIKDSKVVPLDAAIVSKVRQADDGANALAADNDGNIGIGVAPSSAIQLYLAGSTPSGTTQYAMAIATVLDGTNNNKGLVFSPKQTSIATNGFYGIEAGPQFEATAGGPQVNYYGILCFPQVTAAATANITNIYGGFFRIDNNSTAGSVVTNAYTNYIQNPTATGTITNAYGLYINTISSGGTLNYAIYVAGALSRFNGGVIVGGDGGGIASTVGLSNVTSGVSTGNGTVKMNGGTARDSTGWWKIYDGTSARYVPFWTTITG